MYKIIGGVCFIIGLLIIVGFPYISQYQPEAMARAGVIIGLIIMGVGIYLMKI